MFAVKLLQHPTYRAGLALMLGLLMTLAYAPFHQGWLAPLLLAAWLLLLVRSQTAKQALALGFSFGFGWFGAGISWVFVSIDQFGGLPLPFSILLMVILWAYLALFPMLASWIWFKARGLFSGLSLLVFPLVWLLTEWLRGWLFTGFPWLGLGYTQTEHVLGHLAPHIGEVGIAVAVILSAIGFALTLLRKQLSWLLLPLAIYAAALYAPYLNPMKTTGDNLKVALVQGNIELDLKWDPERQWQHLRSYQALSEPYLEEADLIIWPESAITVIEDRASHALDEMNTRAQEHGTALITGIIDYQYNPLERRGDYYNSVIVLGEQPHAQGYYYGNANRYEKHQLLPIGEFVPFESLLRPLAPLFNLPMSSFSRGDYLQSNLIANDFQIAANICYEVAFSRQIRDNMQTDTQLLLTISNDSWFGDSHGPHQHLEIARMRAMELGRPMLRATNSGITALIDERGHIIQQVEPFIPAVASGRVALVEGNTLFYRFGELPAWLIALFIACLAWRKPVTRHEA